jgi:hypothetical protein
MAPALIMALMFGEDFGHTYNFWNGLGALFVIVGLVWMGWNSANGQRKPDWLFWIIAGLIVHISLLTFFQWKALLVKMDLPPSPFLPFQCDPECSNCFTLFMYLSAALMQYFLPHLKSSWRPSWYEMGVYGVLGGVINGLAGVFTLLATETASTEMQKALLFPLYCVTLITLCNIWSRMLYQEKINWPANTVCYAGILISAVA